MPSVALTRWHNDRMPRLGHIDAHCTTLFAPAAAAIPGISTHPPSLAHESLQAYAMLLSGHFQGFCRDLYTECTQICGAATPPGLRATIQAQFAAELRLNSKNPTVENIRKDFERFGFLLDLATADPANPARITHLGHLNYWRNAVAHQKASPPPTGVPAVLSLADIQIWRVSCDGLAQCLDDIMRRELTRILGGPPW